MDEEQKSVISHSLYSPDSPRRQIQTCTNLNNNSDAEPTKDKIRESFKSSENLKNYEGYRNMKNNRRTSMSPAVYTEAQSYEHSPFKSTRRTKPNIHAKVEHRNRRDSKKHQNMAEDESEKETIKLCNDRLSRYQTIVTIIQEENQNLKEQNKYLLEKLRKMKEREQKIKRLYMKTKSYKSKWLQTKSEIQIIKQETFIYRSLLQDFKQIAFVDIPVLKQKVQATQQKIDSNQISISMIKNKEVSLKYNSILHQQVNGFESIEQLAQQLQQKTFVSGINQQGHNGS